MSIFARTVVGFASLFAPPLLPLADDGVALAATALDDDDDGCLVGVVEADLLVVGAGATTNRSR